MIGKKQLGEIKAEIAELLGQLPGPSARAWLRKEIRSAERDRKRDVETLELLCAALERASNKPRKTQSRRKPAGR